MTRLTDGWRGIYVFRLKGFEVALVLLLGSSCPKRKAQQPQWTIGRDKQAARLYGVLCI